MADMSTLCTQARAASWTLAVAGAEAKNRGLRAMADALLTQTDAILAENADDLAAAAAAGMSASLQDRLRLTADRIRGMADGLRQVAALPDPVGEVLEDFVRPNELHIQKVRVPIGVIGIIYEARPNVTADAAALCIKAGNAVVLRGGKEAIRSNSAVMAALRDGLAAAGLPADAAQLVTDTSRSSATAMMTANGGIDLLIPRGGKGLIRAVVENATVPVIETGAGNCHVYVDRAADIPMAASIIVNAKVSRPSVCNAAETLLVHRDIAAQALPVLATALAEHQVRLHGDRQAMAILSDTPCDLSPADDADWTTEYGDLTLAVGVVDSLDAAIAHINRFSTGHSEAIVTNDRAAADEFVARVDSAAVYVNASTRFTDGGEFGMGAEIGISTQKLHARGPMGLRELTSVKFVIHGNGQVR